MGVRGRSQWPFPIPFPFPWPWLCDPLDPGGVGVGPMVGVALDTPPWPLPLFWPALPFAPGRVTFCFLSVTEMVAALSLSACVKVVSPCAAAEAGWFVVSG